MSYSILCKLLSFGRFVQLLVILASLILSACWGHIHDDDEVEPTSQSIDGGGIKGPLSQAVVNAYVLDTTAIEFKGSVAAAPGATDAQARITGLELPFPLAPLYLLEFSVTDETIDLLTGQAPVLTELRTLITEAMLSSGKPIYASPLTTMAVDLAIANANNADGLWAETERDLDADDDGVDELSVNLGNRATTTDEFLTALPIAERLVKSTLGFGLARQLNIFTTPPVLDATTDSQAKQQNTVVYRAAIEALSALVYQLDQGLGTNDADAVLSALTADLSDGQIDGKVGEDQLTSALYGGDEQVAAAALQLLAQDPAILSIPNDPQGRVVGAMRKIVDQEKAALGYELVDTLMDTTEIVALKSVQTKSDVDGDGVVNDLDDVTETTAQGEVDSDGDGVSDALERQNGSDPFLYDTDGDGVLDGADRAPLNPLVGFDSDADGIDHNLDNCPVHYNPNQSNLDRDTWGDACDRDFAGSAPVGVDTDQDGRFDSTDNCPSIANVDQHDLDRDGRGDLCDLDRDGDGVANLVDNCLVIPNNNQHNGDGDALGDACDPDRDGDGLLNPLDNCPLIANADQLDTNGDGIGDACSTDQDADGIVDFLDNCPALANADQLNTDADDLGNACDPDDDQDGLSDSQEATAGTDPLKADSDGDRVIDGRDTFPLDSSDSKDTDLDGIGDNADNDRDQDGIDNSNDNCPLIKNANQADFDQDGAGDACDNDDDNDGVADRYDVFPLNLEEALDQDADLIGDYADNCPLKANPDQRDVDGDGVGDRCDQPPTLQRFYLNQHSVSTEAESGSASAALCPMDIGNKLTRVSLWQQNGSTLELSFGDEDLNRQPGDSASIDASGQVIALRSSSHRDLEGNTLTVALTFDGSWNGLTGVISGTTTETQTFKSSTATTLAICSYTSAESFTPMLQTAASTVFDGASGSNGGWVSMGAYLGAASLPDHPTWEFSYSLIDEVQERSFRYDAASAGDPWSAVPEPSPRYLLGAEGWVAVTKVEVLEQAIVDDVPASTLNLVAKDASDTILASWLLRPFTAAIDQQPMSGLVPKIWAEAGLIEPVSLFTGAEVRAIGIQRESQMALYEVRCAPNNALSEVPALACQNYLISAWADPDSAPTLASSLAQVIKHPAATLTEAWQGIAVGVAENAELFALLTGNNASGAEGSSGAVKFYLRNTDTGVISAATIPTGRWEIQDPLANDTDLVLQFSLPESSSAAYVLDKEVDAVVLSVINDPSDDAPYVRVGRFTAAGAEHYGSGLNVPALEQVKTNFEYTAP